MALCSALLLFTGSHVCFRVTRSIASGNPADVGRLDVTLPLNRWGIWRGSPHLPNWGTNLEPTSTAFQSRVLSKPVYTLSLRPSQQTRLICISTLKIILCNAHLFLKCGPETSCNNIRCLEILFTRISLWWAGKDLAKITYHHDLW